MGGWLSWLWLTGPLDLTCYPACKKSPYRLPFKPGHLRLCVQGNRGIVSHRGPEQFAYDFYLPVGTPLFAARGGKVTYVEVSHSRRWFNAPNNIIVIDHGDNTAAWYVHLMKNGTAVKVGDQVEQGRLVGWSGNTGTSLVPHLHFEVTGPDGCTIPITFADVERHGGIPRILRWYRSANRRHDAADAST